MFASALREAGRDSEAIELYRSVAMAYRDQGRNQQAVAVCRSILELAPNDEVSLALLEQLGGRPTSPSVPAPVSTVSAPKTQPTQFVPPKTTPAHKTPPPAHKTPQPVIEPARRSSRSDATPLPRAVP